jgi:dihydrofolate reductase
VDEVLIHVAPVLIGDGIRLFSQKGMEPVPAGEDRGLGSGADRQHVLPLRGIGPRIHKGIHEEEGSMRKLIIWDMVTVDGFFEGPDRDISWFVFEEELENYIRETQEKADTLVFGRVTYELMAAYWPSEQGWIADFMNKIEKVVFSRTLKSADWNNTKLFNGNVAEEVSKLKTRDGGDIFVFGSADLTATLMEHCLIDEYHLGINPVILGRGTPLFKGGQNRIPLKHLETTTLKSGVVILHYAPESRQ